jgi:hypothetical protein
MTSVIMRECDSGIWFIEEDPTDDCYDPKCCRNVYFDYAIGKFDIIDYKGFEYITINDSYKHYKAILEKYDEYLLEYVDDEAYDGDNEM